MKLANEQAAQSRYLVQLTRKELVQVFSAVKDLRRETTDPQMLAFHESILHKLAQSQENGPVPICEVHQTPMVRMKGKRAVPGSPRGPRGRGERLPPLPLGEGWGEGVTLLV